MQTVKAPNKEKRKSLREFQPTPIVTTCLLLLAMKFPAWRLAPLNVLLRQTVQCLTSEEKMALTAE